HSFAYSSFFNSFLSTSHFCFFLLLLRPPPTSPLFPYTTLFRSGVTRDTILKALTGVRGSQRVTTENPEGTYQALERYGRDLTELDRKSTRLNSSHRTISYAVFCLKKKKKKNKYETHYKKNETDS